jgi:hypothetical protein
MPPLQDSTQPSTGGAGIPRRLRSDQSGNGAVFPRMSGLVQSLAPAVHIVRGGGDASHSDIHQH